jgi:hypothetical protein
LQLTSPKGFPTKAIAGKWFAYSPLPVVGGGFRRLSGNRFSTNLSQFFAAFARDFAKLQCVAQVQLEVR